MKANPTWLIALAALYLSPTGTAQIFYNNAAQALGIQHTYNALTPGCGVSCVDFNNDGLDDLTFATAAGEPLKFFQNTGNQFIEILPLVAHFEEAKQVLWVDYDNDGLKDFFVTTQAGLNRLFRNTGDNFFEDVTFDTGLPLDHYLTFGAVWADYDRDGWLDLYYNERRVQVDEQPNLNRLFRNNGNGTFTEVTDETQTADFGKTPFCSGFLDFNKDRWPDIYTAQDRRRGNSLLQNNGRDTAFTDVSVATHTDLAIEAMSVTVGDYDRNGWLDIYVTNIEEGNSLLRNPGPDAHGNIVFEDVAEQAGVRFYSIAWGAVFLDSDNDADLDLYVSGSLPGTEQPSSAFYENLADGLFLEPSGVGFAGDTVISHTNAVGDFNNDGYPDIAVGNTTPFPSQVWMYQGNRSRHWLKLQLQGVISNRDAIGTTVEIYTDTVRQLHYTQCGNGFLGQNSSTLLFGLGNALQADSIVITWPSGHRDQLFNIAAEQVLRVLEGSTTGGEIQVDPEIQVVAIPQLDNTSTDLKAPICFPNPASELLNVLIEDPGFRHFAILDANGHVLLNGPITASQFAIPVGNLPAGAYFLMIQHLNGRRFTQPWIKAG